jgi:hypothetical protein
MYEALHQRTVPTEIIAREKKCSLWYHHKEKKIPTQSILDGVVVFLLLL